MASATPDSRLPALGIMRERLLDRPLLSGPSMMAAGQPDGESLLATMQSDGSWPDINYADTQSARWQG